MEELVPTYHDCRVFTTCACVCVCVGSGGVNTLEREGCTFIHSWAHTTPYCCTILCVCVCVCVCVCR